jgi:hypothetical protein
MKKLMLFIGILLFMVACASSSDSDSSSEAGDTAPQLSAKLAKILPAPTASSTSNAGLSQDTGYYPMVTAENWSDSDSAALGSPIYALFRLFGPEDHGSYNNWGAENMQHNLKSMEQWTGPTVMNTTNGTALGNAISTLPYDEFTRITDAATIFDYTYNMKVTSPATDSYLAWDNASPFAAIGVYGMDQDGNGVQEELSSFEGTFNASTDELDLNLAMYTYEFAIRIEAQGNTGTSEVTMLKLAKHNPSSSTAYKLSMVVKGMVQGVTGSYLAKVKIKDGSTEIQDVYYCIQSNTDEDEFKAAFVADDGSISSSYIIGKTVNGIIVTTNTADLSNSDCSAYVSAVSGAAYIDYDDTGVMPSATSDFTVAAFWE